MGLTKCTMSELEKPKCTVIVCSGSIGEMSCPDFKKNNVKIELENLNAMGSEAIMDCLGFFGKDPLNDAEGKYIWNVTLETHGPIEEIPDNILLQLGWIMRVIETEELYNLTLKEVDVITAFGQFRNLSQEQVLAERVQTDWADKTPSDYTNFDLSALQHILCGFNRSSIGAIHADSYKDAAISLSTLRGCPQDILEALLELAINSEAFGATLEWTSSQVRNVGCLLNGMSATLITTIPPVGLESANPDIMNCLLPETLRKLTTAQLSHFSPSVVGAISGQQREVLSQEQIQAITDAYLGVEGSKDTSNRQQHLIFLIITLYITVATI